jgi:two-component system nitrogen regulation sensor histidine kinase NtrY
MRKRLLYGLGIVMLAISIILVVRQQFNFGDPVDPSQTILIWALTIINFILMVTLSFMLGRMALKLYFERRADRFGSRIKTKLVIGAMGLICLPVFFMLFFCYNVLNYNLTRWFTIPPRGIDSNLTQIDSALRAAWLDRAAAQAELLASLPETTAWITGDQASTAFLTRFCAQQRLSGAALYIRGDQKPAVTCGQFPVQPNARRNHSGEAKPDEVLVYGRTIRYAGHDIGIAEIASRLPLDVVQKQREIAIYRSKFAELSTTYRSLRQTYLLVLSLITLFILFAGTWLADFLARQISVPIAALATGAEEVSKGNLQYRIHTRAIDELAGLIRGFNQMTQDLEANSRELETRRRFTEAILESIPTGVLSINSAGVIRRVNRALKDILPLPVIDRAVRLEDLFSREDAAEIRYLMNRARRTGIAAQQFEIQHQGRTLHLAITVSALEDRSNSGFVIVLEDTSDLLRAQKATAWREVARRIAHEIKNPLTPITLSAERILRQIDRMRMPNDGQAVMLSVIRECAETIVGEAQTVKNLVDEFARFSRMPAAQPAPCELNEVVESALAVFTGRLEGIDLERSLAPGLPQVNIDREQFKRVVVNLVDNAAEAMTESLVRRIFIETRAGLADTVELIVADSGCGVTAEDKEKLFLPYFSTKGRGTGLGLAIVNHILSDHNAHIRVDDNVPTGARFTIEIPAIVEVSEPVSV